MNYYNVKKVFDVDLKYNFRFLDPVMKYCQGCKYGIINYSGQEKKQVKKEKKSWNQLRRSIENHESHRG